MLLQTFCFNPRTHTGCDHANGLLLSDWCRFQSTHPHRVRPAKASTTDTTLSFNPRTHTGCDSVRRLGAMCWCCFNPRTHTGCDGNAWCQYLKGWFQSTHPHRVRQNILGRTVSVFAVSIHAPTQGATSIGTSQYTVWNVSIHAPTQGATQLPIHSCVLYQFQSTHPHRVRLVFHGGLPAATKVSIHAPTQGATNSELLKQELQRVSIHAPTQGATEIAKKLTDEICVSIHAPTQGATRLANNPAKNTGVSIHAPTQGATNSRYGTKLRSRFQSTHPHRVRQTKSNNAISSDSFNPRTHTGCDIRRCERSNALRVSIHAPTQGATGSKDILKSITKFQSTHPHRVRQSYQ